MLVILVQSTTKDYLRAEGSFHKEIQYIVERTNKAEIRQEEQSEKHRVITMIYGMKYS